jgi:hypothetical protein
MPPAPSGEVISYGPSFVPEVSAIEDVARIIVRLLDQLPPSCETWISVLLTRGRSPLNSNAEI